MIDWLMLKDMYKASKRKNQQLISKENSQLIDDVLSLREQSVKINSDIENNILHVMQDILNSFHYENKSLIGSMGEKINRGGQYGHCRKCGKKIDHVDNIGLAQCEKNCDFNYNKVSEWCYNHHPSFHYRYGLGKLINKNGGY